MLCAIYVRLSKEDENKDRTESESIQNQKSLLVDYAEEHSWDIYEVYCEKSVIVGIKSRRLLGHKGLLV